MATGLLDDEFPMMLERETGMRPEVPEVAVAFGFFPILDKKQTKEHEREIYRDVEYVKIAVPNDQKSLLFQPADDVYRRRFPRAYESFQRRQQTGKVEGMPLLMWGPISRGAAFTLMAAHIQTVESLSKLGEEHLARFPGNIRELRDKAIIWLKTAEDTAALTKVEGEKLELRNQLDSLAAQLAAMQERERERQAAADGGASITTQTAPPPPPGSPAATQQTPPQERVETAGKAKTRAA